MVLLKRLGLHATLSVRHLAWLCQSPRARPLPPEPPLPPVLVLVLLVVMMVAAVAQTRAGAILVAGVVEFPAADLAVVAAADLAVADPTAADAPAAVPAVAPVAALAGCPPAVHHPPASPALGDGQRGKSG
eukprot:m.102541 g.102541  ORF g.102541 m.102541 type:complete len:131 (+) comp14122_c1_seq1:3405-3797(+)